jgi:MFS family permease
LKIVSGRVSDRWRSRRPLVIAGYGLSSAIRPLTALVTSWPQLFAVRFVDRVGKGVRGAPRDALLAACATADTRGRVFGFHRAMDHVGAVLGPVLASLILLAWPGQYRWLFGLTAIPGAVAVAMLFLVREESAGVRSAEAARTRPQPATALVTRERTEAPEAAPATRLPRSLYTLLVVLVVFALGNSADAFLLLRLSDLGVRDAFIPLIWALLHVIKAGTSVWGGIASDRWGRRGLIGAGWFIYAVVYAGFAAASSASTLLMWFVVYGVYYGLSEGTEKALVADLAPADLRGTAFGYYNAATGLGSLAASVGFGLVWKLAGPATAFGLGAALALLATLLLFIFVPEPRTTRG